jgi:hypothetical protein
VLVRLAFLGIIALFPFLSFLRKPDRENERGQIGRLVGYLGLRKQRSRECSYYITYPVCSPSNQSTLDLDLPDLLEMVLLYHLASLFSNRIHRRLQVRAYL